MKTFKKILESRLIMFIMANVIYALFVIAFIIDGITFASSLIHIVLQYWFPIFDQIVYMYFFGTFGALIAQLVALPTMTKMIKKWWGFKVVYPSKKENNND